MSFDLFKVIEKATQQWRLAHNLEPQMRHSPACPGGVKDGIYTQEYKYSWGSEWIAFEDASWPDGPRGLGRTEQEAIENLKEQL